MSSRTPLGMPTLPPPTRQPTWKTAWDRALYGPDGFFRRESPAAHFRTSVHVSAGLDTVVDLGAGRGELLRAAHALDPDLTLLGVEVADRPEDLPDAVGWTALLPASVEGLVIANEWLDNVPCHVVEVDPSGVPRIVHVDPRSGEETLGAAVRDPSVPASVTAWLERWWPLEVTEAGTRAEVGTTRDAAWADVVGRVGRGLAVAVDYGHVREDRPPFGSLRSYRDGREVDVRPDGSRDVTAHVAVDAVVAAAGGVVVPQRRALQGLGVSGARPDLAQASSDPAGYLRRLAVATEAAELTDRHGLGAFSWMVTVRDVEPPAWLLAP
jgi:SAM-dependent MidA family methyltransferase